MRRLVLVLFTLALLAPAPALALHDDPGGGGPICYWTWDHRFVCGP